MGELLPIPRGVVVPAGQFGHGFDAPENVDDGLCGGKLHSGNLPEKISDCNTQNFLRCPENNLVACDARMVNWRDMSISDRLKVLRRSLNMTQGAFAQLIGEDPESDSYGSAERSGNLSRRMTTMIYARCEGVDAGWLFHGLTGNVPSGTLKRLEEAANAIAGRSVRSKART